MRLALALVLAFAALPAAAQVRPQPGAGDRRLQTIDYAADQVVILEVAAGYMLTVELAPDEQIENVALGDSGAWQVTANRRGDRLFIKPLQGGISTNMT
ncbi:MAG TPA: TrbG/VirB9 family P-type conjugative transfer protein, partial [Allosphingosinicella sp.]|nr:TrbG/VirB9 family P-type conjugative transfer protein [Allosphingosinicella sp.]